MNGVTARLFFCCLQEPKNMSENLPKDTQDFVSSASIGGIRLHTWGGMKETYSCLQGNFMIMGTWGLINLFN